MEELINSATRWLNNIQIVDPSVVVYGFKDNEPTHGILRSSDIPSGLVAFKEFFMGANPSGEEGFVWTNIWIGHALEADDMFRNFKFWLKKNETVMYIKKLQEKHTVGEYFLLWSTSEMCPQKLHDATQLTLKKVTKEKFK